ncbi:MAG: putative oxidoreductase [Halieaceae bacterium]|jgi:putative oxidoreductase
MERFFDMLQRPLLLTGRGLLGLYFIIPGLTKVTGFSAMSEYMAAHGVPFIPVLLVITIIIQVGGGVCLVAGYRAQIIAFVLAGLTLLISVFMHDFWSMEESVARGHEMQNFIKNMAIMAGLMFVAGTPKGEKA